MCEAILFSISRSKLTPPVSRNFFVNIVRLQQQQYLASEAAHRIKSNCLHDISSLTLSISFFCVFPLSLVNSIDFPISFAMSCNPIYFQVTFDGITFVSAHNRKPRPIRIRNGFTRSSTPKQNCSRSLQLEDNGKSQRCSKRSTTQTKKHHIASNKQVLHTKVVTCFVVRWQNGFDSKMRPISCYRQFIKLQPILNLISSKRYISYLMSTLSIAL